MMRNTLHLLCKTLVKSRKFLFLQSFKISDLEEKCLQPADHITVIRIQLSPGNLLIVIRPSSLGVSFQSISKSTLDADVLEVGGQRSTATLRTLIPYPRSLITIRDSIPNQTVLTIRQARGRLRSPHRASLRIMRCVSTPARRVSTQQSGSPT